MSVSLSNFLDLPQYNFESVQIAGKEFFVRSLTAEERDEYEASRLKITNNKGRTNVTPNWKNSRAKLIQMTLCEGIDNPKLVFTKDDVGTIASKSSSVIEPLYEAALRLSGISKEDEEELKKS